MLILSPCLKIGVILAIFKSGGIIPVSNEELIMAETTPATDPMVFLAINGSIPSGPGEREYFAKFAKLIISWGLVGSRPNVNDFFEMSRISRFMKGLKSASEVGKSILGHF